jgi:hypothetical protein
MLWTAVIKSLNFSFIQSNGVSAKLQPNYPLACLAKIRPCLKVGTRGSKRIFLYLGTYPEGRPNVYSKMSLEHLDSHGMSSSFLCWLCWSTSLRHRLPGSLAHACVCLREHATVSCRLRGLQKGSCHEHSTAESCLSGTRRSLVCLVPTEQLQGPCYVQPSAEMTYPPVHLPSINQDLTTSTAPYLVCVGDGRHEQRNEELSVG